jgi:hypothetical protein
MAKFWTSQGGHGKILDQPGRTWQNFGPARADTYVKWTSQGGHGKILDQPGRTWQHFGPANADMRFQNFFWKTYRVKYIRGQIFPVLFHQQLINSGSGSIERHQSLKKIKGETLYNKVFLFLNWFISS